MADYTGAANRHFLNLGRIVKPGGHIDVSAGTEMPPGILGSPMAKGGTTLTARASDNTTPNRITGELRGRLDTMTPELAQRVRDVVDRKR